jgi:hypothetical protein
MSWEGIVPVQAYGASTSVVQGGTLDFHLNDANGIDATVTVTQHVTGTQVLTESLHVAPSPTPTPPDPAADRGWPVQFSLFVPTTWASGLYRADFSPGSPSESTFYFVVRPAQPGAGSPILVSIPFPTLQAYLWAGSGASPYWNEQPDRARRVSLQRPNPSGPGWEDGMLSWLATSGYDINYCSGFDLHDGSAGLESYQLLICLGHDEYWTSDMRDAAEAFLGHGGNIAFFTGNTCWWQFRIEDDGKTFVLYRDSSEAYSGPLKNIPHTACRNR